jgi:hypothetical protein
MAKKIVYSFSINAMKKSAYQVLPSREPGSGASPARQAGVLSLLSRSGEVRAVFRGI